MLLVAGVNQMVRRLEMSHCIYKVNHTGQFGVDVDSKFPEGRRDGYTILECGLKTREEAEARIEEIKAEEASKKK